AGDRRADRQLRQQSARRERKSAPAEPVGRNRNLRRTVRPAREQVTMTTIVATLATLFAAHAWAGAGDLRLKPCADPKLTQPAKCGTYTVWENRTAKAGRTIDLNVVVLQATGAGRKPDPLFVLLGGPGEGAAGDAEHWVEDPVRTSRDLVFVDARGTGKSNGLHCPIAME